MAARAAPQDPEAPPQAPTSATKTQAKLLGVVSSSSTSQERSHAHFGPTSAATAAAVSEVFLLPRKKSRGNPNMGRRESRMLLIDGQLVWSDHQELPHHGGSGHLSSMDVPIGKRHSSAAFTIGSSMDLSQIGASMDSSGAGGSGSEEAAYRIKWCRESIMRVKRQTWPMERKLQVLKASKLFIKQHQGDLKQSKQAGDMLISASTFCERYWRHFKRELANFLVIITPWEMRIKNIESHFGSVVASYFTFLRWLFWLNLANSLIMIVFVMVPELIENAPDYTGMRRGELGKVPLGYPNAIVDLQALEKPDFNPTLREIIEFEGFLKASPIFYGYYSNRVVSRMGFWRNPLAFLLSAMISYMFCFFCISRKLSKNNKLSQLGSKEDEYTFCWTVFVGWDFMIGNSETAYNKTSSLVMNLKEGILEEREQTKERNWKLIMRRVLANVITVMIIVASAYIVMLAVERDEAMGKDGNFFQQNQLAFVMSSLQIVCPPMFDGIGNFEQYHPRTALNWQLGRILSLDFLNMYTLMFSLLGTVGKMTMELNQVTQNINKLRLNETYYKNLFTTTTTTSTTTTTTTTTTTMSSLTDANLTSITILNDTTDANVTQNSVTQLMDSATTTKPLNNQTIDLTTESQASTLEPEDDLTTITITSVNPLEASEASTIIVQLPSTTSTEASEASQPSEEDYPDLSQIIQPPSTSTQSSKRQLNKPRRLSRQAQSDGLLHSPRAQQNKQEDPQQEELLVALPPLRDPYLPGQHQVPGLPGVLGGRDDQEEYLEGRLRAPTGDPYVATTHPAATYGTSTTSTRLSSFSNDQDDPSGDGQTSSVRVEELTESIATTISVTIASPFATNDALDSSLTSTMTPSATPAESGAATVVITPRICPFVVPGADEAASAPGKLENLTTALGGGNGTTNATSGVSVAKLKNDTKEPDDCAEIPDLRDEELLALNSSLSEKLMSLCWETMLGQEMAKQVVMDLVMTVLSAIGFEFTRACFVRYCNRFFFWDLERRWPCYQDFKIAENVLHLANNQSFVWLGMFFAPGLPAINTVKLAVLMYVRSWAVLTCNIPHDTVFKSTSNNFYYFILLLNLLVCFVPVAYAVTWMRPSWHCGPFGGECRMYAVMTKLVMDSMPPKIKTVFSYLTSPGAVIPMIILFVLIIYYLASTLGSSKEANRELKAQLKKDKEATGAQLPEITSTAVPDNSGAGSVGVPVSAVGTPSVATVLGQAAEAQPPQVAPIPAAVVGSEQLQASKPKSLLLLPPPINPM